MIENSTPQIQNSVSPPVPRDGTVWPFLAHDNSWTRDCSLDGKPDVLVNTPANKRGHSSGHPMSLPTVFLTLPSVE